MNLLTVMDELSKACKPLFPRSYGYPVERVEPPCAVVSWPDLVEYDVTYTRGHDRLEIPVVAVFSRNNNRTARNLIARALQGDVRAAIEDYQYSNEVVVVCKSGEVEVIEIAGTNYLSCTFTVEVTGPA